MNVGLYPPPHPHSKKTPATVNWTSLFEDIVILRKCNSQLQQACSVSLWVPLSRFWPSVTAPTLTMQNLLLSLHIISPKFIPLCHLFLFSEEKKKISHNKQSVKFYISSLSKKAKAVGKEGFGQNLVRFW